MKHGTPGHIKMRRLARLLKIPRPHAVGIMECLWDSAPNCCLAGDIGRLSDDEIADVADWHDDPAAFVEALCRSGWIDRDSTHRLVIHDWDDHAPLWVKKRAKVRKVKLLTRGDQPFNASATLEESGGNTTGEQSKHCGQKKFALPALPSCPSLPTPPPPKGGGGGEVFSAERERAKQALMADPWPMLSRAKATVLAHDHPPPTIHAAIDRARKLNLAGGKVGGGLVAVWIESGEAQFRLDARKQATARNKARDWWARGAKDGEREMAVTMYERDTGTALPAGGLHAVDAFMDFIADRFESHTKTAQAVAS